jgi:hypothetical protein
MIGHTHAWTGSCTLFSFDPNFACDLTTHSCQRPARRRRNPLHLGAGAGTQSPPCPRFGPDRPLSTSAARPHPSLPIPTLPLPLTHLPLAPKSLASTPCPSAQVAPCRNAWPAPPHCRRGAAPCAALAIRTHWGPRHSGAARIGQFLEPAVHGDRLEIGKLSKFLVTIELCHGDRDQFQVYG